MLEIAVRLIAVVALTTLAWLLLTSAEGWIMHIPGANLLADFPVVLPVIGVFGVLSAISRVHESLKHRHTG